MAVIAKRYAEALINTAIQEKNVEKYTEELDTASTFVLNKQVRDILEYPGVNLGSKKALVKGLMKEKVDKDIVNFLMILLDNDRLKYFSDIVSEYKAMADEYKDILFVEITSAEKLDGNQINRIKAKLSSQYGTSNIKANLAVDPSVIGGVKLKIGDTVIDGTVKARLENLEKVIKEK